MGPEVATSSPQCRSLCRLSFAHRPISYPALGRKIWTVFPGFAQSERLYQHGSSFESSQRRSGLGHRHSHHIFTVSTWTAPLVIVLIVYRYNFASSTHLVSRLTSRNLHLLALRISTYLSLKPDVVLKHWACAKITKSKPTATGTGNGGELEGDEEVCKSIVEKFSKLGGGSVSYADIAKKAWEVGRLDLATKVQRLLYHPPHGVLTQSGLRAAVRPRTARIRPGPLTSEHERRQTRAGQSCG